MQHRVVFEPSQVKAAEASSAQCSSVTELPGQVGAGPAGRFFSTTTKSPSSSPTSRIDSHALNMAPYDLGLRAPALTHEDINHLKQIAKYADAVGLSFEQRPSDVDDLLRAIGKPDATVLGIVLKIEMRTRKPEKAQYI